MEKKYFILNKIRNFLHFNAWILVLDILAFSLSYLLGLYIRFYSSGTLHLGQQYIDAYWHFIPFCTSASVLVFFAFRLYGGMWQFAGLRDFNRIVITNIITVVLHVGISMLVITLLPDYEGFSLRMPISYYVIGSIIQLFMTCITRFLNRFIFEEKRRLSRKVAVNVMLVGTGETARIVRRQLEDDEESATNIVCIFSYKDSEIGSLVNGIPVVGDLKQLNDYFIKYQIKRVILADSIMPMSVRDKIRRGCQEDNIELQDFSGFLRYDNIGLSFQRLMACLDGSVTVLKDGKPTNYENGEQALMSVTGKREVKSVSVRENTLFVELVSHKVEPLILFYITNRPDVALVAEKYGVDRIWVDLETRGKEERQRNLNSVKSKHSISDIAQIKPLLSRAEMMVRVNSWYDGSKQEIDAVIAAGADIIMLPYWKTAAEVKAFVGAVRGRCKTSLLLETREAVECVDEVLKLKGIDEIHIGLNDLHLSYGMSFMFEPLSNGTVEMLCNKFRKVGIPYGFGGIAKLGDGVLPAERVIMEHYRLGSTRAILSRSFCDCAKISNIEEIDTVFRENMGKLREYELSMADVTSEEFARNKVEVEKAVNEIAERITLARSNGL